MKSSVKRMGLIAVVGAALAALLLMSGCAANFNKANEDMSNKRQLGEPSNVSVGYKFIFGFDWGPYDMTVTPLGFCKMPEETYEDAFVYDFVVTGLPEDEDEINFDTCLTAVTLLTEELEEVDHSSVWVREGHEFIDAYDGEYKIELNKHYQICIPLVNILDRSKLAYVAVSDRSGFYSRKGGMSYFYPVDINNPVIAEVE